MQCEAELKLDRINETRESIKFFRDVDSRRFKRDRRVLIIVENLSVPFDRRVWSEATTLIGAGYQVSVICPMGQGHEEPYECLEGVHIYRHPQLFEAHGAFGYFREYGSALWHEVRLALKVWRERGFDVIQGCNPPDLIFLIALLFRPLGVRFLFDHHDVCPELFEAKFGRRGFLWLATRIVERLTFMTASVSIATNDSFAAIARGRGGMRDEDVFVVRSAPPQARFKVVPADASYRQGAERVIGYVGVIGQQEGMDLLVEAANHLIKVQGRRKLRFLVIGFGTQLEATIEDVARRGLAEHFCFTGALRGEEMIRVLNAADICVSPDPKNAMNDISTMNKVIEYMLLSKPIVQFDVKEGRASAGPAALYARPNDPIHFALQIARLLDDPSLCDKMGKMGRSRVVEQLSWEHSSARLLAAYDRVFARRALPAREDRVTVSR